MNTRRQLTITILTLSFAGTTLLAQNASRGVTMPLTVTGGLLVSDRAKAQDPYADSAIPGFRAVFYPGLKINRKWFVQSTIAVKSEPFYYYEDFYARNDVETTVQQLFLGYQWSGEESSVVFKTGRLDTAFGSFPLRYSDSVNPLLDQPFSYAYALRLRPDQMPCGADDLAHQQTHPSYVYHYCGGATSDRSGMVPVTLYGLPGVEVNASWHKVDSRFQLTNSSPANPQALDSKSQHAQWTAGIGYTIRQGFRIGVSGFRGPFLEEDIRSLLPAGTKASDYPATAIGTDLQWGRGRWNANAEWQRVEFRYPGFVVPPAVSSGYMELKATLNPRLYAAIRTALENHSRVEDTAGIRADPFLPNRQSYEVALGYRFNRFQTLKAGYEWFRTDGYPGNRDNIFGVEFVTAIHSLSKSF